MTRARREQTMIVSKKPRSLVPCLWISPTHTHRRLGVGGEKTRNSCQKRFRRGFRQAR